MNCNAAGQKIIRDAEGCELKPYQDAAGVWTVGRGHAILTTEPDLMHGIDQEEAESLFLMDLARAERAVTACTTARLNECQFSSLCSFVFNLGGRAYRDSTLRALVNQERYIEAAGQFGRWVHAGGRVLPGLVKRREAERALFQKLPWLENA